MSNKRILIDAEGRKFLSRAFGVSEQMVSYALNFRRHSDLAKKIRSLALQRGGNLVGDDITTIYESNGDMVQSWGERARLYVNKSSGVVRIYINGELDREYPSMTIAELLKEQKRISLLVGIM